MASDFFYFISSLPLLRFGEKASLDYDSFLGLSRTSLSETEVDVLVKLQLFPVADSTVLPLLAQWQESEIYLRNLVAAARARKQKTDGERWQRESNSFSAALIKRVDEIMILPNAWEKEMALDLIRWQRLDELSTGHFFDFTAVVIYALRLLILEKHRRYEEEPGSRFAAELVEEGLQQAEAQRVETE